MAAPNIPVLMYHHISPNPGSITTSPANFAQQMRWLARQGWHTLSAEEFAAYLHDGKAPRKSIVLTFDDGYLDNWVYAHPVLEQYGLKAWMFLVTDWVGNGAVRPHAGLAALGTPLPETPDHSQCKAILAAGQTDAVIVRWSEVEAMKKAGTFEFHSHSHTHIRWDLACASVSEKRERLAHDLETSRTTLKRQLGEVSPHLCWPQGYFDSDYLEVGTKTGFRYFYTTDARGQNLPGQDPSHIYRIAIKNRGALQFGNRVWLARSPTAGPIYNRWKQRGSANASAATSGRSRPVA